MTIVVTNGTEKTIKGRYAGQDHEFPVGVEVAVSADIARHIFGFGESDKTEALTRLGWMVSSSDAEVAYERLALVKFGVPSTDAPQVSNDGPLVNADGTSGGAVSSDAAPLRATKTERLKRGAEKIV